ncbi:hypothetical protein AVEN_263839-1 [Araneus ventricosus]|uniref:Uncharacterized protein n=1 Tax=Araneus ventricosus TaxID=182803 RepID=A0A4Y2E0Y1_ARAVE|nr:hypothetical protein AVEN_263839-1 [Araneus ventricosus]
MLSFRELAESFIGNRKRHIADQQDEYKIRKATAEQQQVNVELARKDISNQEELYAMAASNEILESEVAEKGSQSGVISKDGEVQTEENSKFTGKGCFDTIVNGEFIDEDYDSMEEISTAEDEELKKQLTSFQDRLSEEEKFQIMQRVKNSGLNEYEDRGWMFSFKYKGTTYNVRCKDFSEEENFQFIKDIKHSHESLVSECDGLGNENTTLVIYIDENKEINQMYFRNSDKI